MTSLNSPIDIKAMNREQLILLRCSTDVILLSKSERRLIDSMLHNTSILNIPLNVLLLITFYSYQKEVTQCIIKVRGISYDKVNKSTSTMDVLLYGSEKQVTAFTKNCYTFWSIDSARVIDYTKLDLTKAPLYINWYWLSSSMKQRLFNS
jgi:hypothetical protein